MTKPATINRQRRLPRFLTGDAIGRTWLAWVLILLGVMMLALALLVATRIAPLLLEPNRYADTISIERSPEYRDATLMREAWRLPVANLYAAHIFEFQHNESFCGPTSAADVLHSLGDHRPQDSMLEGTPYHALLGYLLGGLTLDQEADLLRRQSHRPVRVLRGLSLDQFRWEMRAVNDRQHRYIINFHRGPLFGRGHGHFSPLLAYLADRDLVLVGDVNAHYRPFLVSTSRLWQAVNTVDEATQKKRGLLVL